ncbi:MAG: hypothetical protein K6T29_07955 [Peptococcaceae bacterium]|nr:hypothetical protein [Peptococcaceae bacterium]
MTAGIDQTAKVFDLKARLAAQIRWLTRCQILRPGEAADGAISRYPDQGWITPYFSSFAALAMLYDPDCHHRVRRFLDWYLRHLRADGTVPDYQYGEDGAVRTAKPDSEDSYAATILSLAAAYCRTTGDTAWAAANMDRLKKVAGVMVRLMKKDGLTYALASHRVKYLMDNCEVYKGFDDFAGLLQSLGDPAAAYYSGKAAAVAGGIEKALWNARSGSYHSAIIWPFLKSGTDWKKFYPDAACQVFPALYGLLDPASRRAQDLYGKLTQNHDWVHIRPPDYPWMILGYCACLHGDYGRALEKVKFTEEVYIKSGSGNWFCAESAFYVMTCAALLSGLNARRPGSHFSAPAL